MPILPSGRRKKRPQNKTRYKKGGAIDWSARIPFYNHDPEYAKMYSTARWKKIRRIIMERDPMCPICMHNNQLVAATDVDHVVAHKGDHSLFHSLDNLWALSRDCHYLKTAMESNGVEYRTKKEWVEAILEYKSK